MKKKRVKIILMFAIVAVVFGGITVGKKVNSKATSYSCQKLYFYLGEKDTVKTVLNAKINTAQGMCVNGNTAYMAILKRPKVNGVEEQRVYIYKVENITSSNPKIIEPTDYISVGHANGMEYRNGDLIIAPSVEYSRGIYRVGMEQAGDKMRYYIKKKYTFNNSTKYGITSKTFAKSIAYYKTTSGVPYYIVGIGQSTDKTQFRYMIGYFSEYDGKFIPIKGFRVEKSGSKDYMLDGAQDISCVRVNGRIKLVSTVTGAYEMTLSNGYWPHHTRNLAYVTDVTSVSNKAVLNPEKRIGINYRKYHMYEIEAFAFVNENGKLVPYGLFNIWEQHDQKYHYTRLYKYNYSLN